MRDENWPEIRNIKGNILSNADNSREKEPRQQRSEPELWTRIKIPDGKSKSSISTWSIPLGRKSKSFVQPSQSTRICWTSNGWSIPVRKVYKLIHSNPSNRHLKWLFFGFTVNYSLRFDKNHFEILFKQFIMINNNHPIIYRHLQISPIKIKLLHA